MGKIRIGTRGSELALWQAHHIQMLLKNQGVESEIVIIRTKGDEIQHLGLDKMEGKGFFTKEIEDALLKNEVDVAVHSHKDLETEQPFGLQIAAVSHRADASELIIIHPSAKDDEQLFGFKANAVIGTSSSRRKAQIFHHRNDITLRDIRGNVPTRVEKLRQGDFDAILIAKAGVDRLNLDLSGLIVLQLSIEQFVPAPAQGALAIQCRTDDEQVTNFLKKINHPETAELTGIERGVLQKMNGGCHLPLGVFAAKKENHFYIRVSYAEAWNSPVRYLSFYGEDADALTDQIVRSLNAK